MIRTYTADENCPLCGTPFTKLQTVLLSLEQIQCSGGDCENGDWHFYQLGRLICINIDTYQLIYDCNNGTMIAADYIDWEITHEEYDLPAIPIDRLEVMRENFYAAWKNIKEQNE
jgi:hypothetical protein